MFRIIMPVYNAESYLEEAIESILHQSLPFEKNITLHLIDDASTDRSAEICARYKAQYPRNILVTRFKENQGVSRARNYGVKKCRFKRKLIVGFVDADDRLDKNALQTMQTFFETHPDVQMASAQIEFFGAQSGPHKSNWRFEEREVVNIDADYNFPQYYIGGFFLRKRALKNLRFDEDMRFWEDALAINRVILQIGEYGLARGAVYYYRKMEDASSLVDKSWEDPARYTTFLESGGYMRLIEYCKKQYKKVPLYIQHLVAYHLRLYLVESHRETVLRMVPEEEMPAFKARLGKVLGAVSNKVILGLNTSLPIVEMMLSLKRDKKVRMKKTCTENDLVLSYKETELARLSGRRVLLFETLDKPDFEGMRRGRFTTPVYAMRAEDYIFAEHNGQRIEAVRYPCKRRLYILDELMRNYKHAGFAIKLPDDWETAQFGLHTEGTDILLNTIDLKEREIDAE